MASWLTKDTELIQGAADQAFQPSGAPTENKRQDCLNTCNDRYQKDLDNPSVDYMEAQRRYVACKATCEDVATAFAGPTVGALPPTPEPPGPPGPPAPPGPTPPQRGNLVCYQGKCIEKANIPPGTTGRLKYCAEGSVVGGECNGVPVVKCVHDSDCPEGERCDNGVCVPIEEPTPPEPTPGEGCEGGYILSSDPIAGGAGSVWTDENISAGDKWYRDPNAEGHRIWHKDWGFQMLEDVYAYLRGEGTLTKSTAGACKKGFKQESIGGEAWCCPSEVAEDGTPGLGEYGIPGWLQELLDMLMGRGKELLDPSQYGYSQEAMDAMFGRGFEKVRGQAGATRETIQDVLSRSGMIGTGAETSKMAESAWETERGISDLQRDLMIKGEEQRKKDLLSHTGLAQDIFSGAGIGSEAFREMINVGRRGERKSWYQMLLDFFQGLKY